LPDRIQLLSDHVANQIAAGEVIQRPASAVKELLENAVDAGATEIKLIIRDAGKELVQVVDNGCGMSETDARMSLERHATSKITKIEDLFHIHSMGFRGEALASIAAVSQMEIKTRKPDVELGSYMEIENSEVVKQEPCSCPSGTSIAMKNLFFSIPARKNFLKRNATEMKHIVNEFTRVALAFPKISFSLETNGQELYHLGAGKLKQRVLQIIGSSYQSKLVPVEENTDYMNLTGFVGKPDASKKTRGDQYLFVNGRYIRSGYLNHAIMGAFEELIPKDHYPLYVLYIELDSSQIDINVHPTKQEIKFEDERIIYAFVKSAIKHALAQFSITPTLDFELDHKTQHLPSISQPFTEKERKRTTEGGIYQGFTQKHQSHTIESNNLQNWQDLYPKRQTGSFPTPPTAEKEEDTELEQQTEAINISETPKKPQQIHKRYILQQIISGFILIDQQLAHERILYERYQQAFDKTPLSAQKSLFPEILELSLQDATLLKDLLPELKTLGYEIEQKTDATFSIHGIPSNLDSGDEKRNIEGLLEQIKHFNADLQTDKREQMIRSLAQRHAIKPGKKLSSDEMQSFIDQLFACSQSQMTPSGKYTFIPFRTDELDKMFGR